MKKNNKFLIINKDHIINYIYIEPKENMPVVIFLVGYKSFIDGKKAQYLYEYCNKGGYGYLTFEYRGHGESSGDINDFTLEDWFNDMVLTINNFVKDRKKILIGSSMGGWLAFLYATRFPKLITGLIGIAPALDFLHDLENYKYNEVNDSENSNLIVIEYKCGTLGHFNKKLLENYKEFLLLQNSFINLEIPIRLLHGLKDAIVPYQKSLLISEKILGEDVIVTLVKNGDHSLSTPYDLDLLGYNLEDILKKDKSVENKEK